MKFFYTPNYLFIAVHKRKYSGLRKKSCSSPPHLSDYTDLEKEQYFCDLEAKTAEIQKRFARVTSKMYQSFERDKVSVSLLVITIRANLFLITDRTPIEYKIKRKLDKANSIRNIQSAIDDYYNYCNFELIECLIKDFGTSRDKKRLKKYVKKFEKFVFTIYNNRVINCSKFIPGLNRITLKLEIGNDDFFTGDTITNQIKRRLSKIIGVKSSQLFLCKIRGGCIEFNFSVSDCVCRKILSLKAEQRVALFQENIVSVQCYVTSKVRSTTSTRLITVILSISRFNHYLIQNSKREGKC